MFRRGGRMMLASARSTTKMASDIRPPPKTDLAPVTHVRKLFPETWLWKTLETSYVACRICTSLVIYIILILFCLAYYPRPIPLMAMRGGDGNEMMFNAAPQMNMMMADSARAPSKSELAPVTHVRKLFPETWLWKTLETS